MGYTRSGNVENEFIEEACALDVLQVEPFVRQLLKDPRLDVVAFYLRIDTLNNIAQHDASMNATVLYELLRELRDKPSPEKGQTIARAAEQRAGDVRGSLAGIGFEPTL